MESKHRAKDGEMTKKAFEKEKEFGDTTLQVEGTKTPDLAADVIKDMKADPPEKTMVRGEDVLEMLRRKGVRI